jgi:hypothetical protein
MSALKDAVVILLVMPLLAIEVLFPAHKSRI